jgi:hypothetical protein
MGGERSLRAPGVRSLAVRTLGHPQMEIALHQIGARRDRSISYVFRQAIDRFLKEELSML